MPAAEKTETRFAPLALDGDLYYRRNGAVFGPIRVNTLTQSIRVFTVDGRCLRHPLSDAGLDAAVLDATATARVGEAYAGAIDLLLRKPGLARHGHGSIVR